MEREREGGFDGDQDWTYGEDVGHAEDADDDAGGND